MTPALLARLIALSGENEFLEFKRNNDNPESLGIYISALSNSATLAGVSHGYLIWGVDDARRIVGTQVSPWDRKIGNEPLENWLARLLYPGINFAFGETALQGARIAWLEVPAASHTPVRFRDFEYVRIGQVTKKLRDLPEKERVLWSKFAVDGFEKEAAGNYTSLSEALATLDFDAYSRLCDARFTSPEAIGQRFEAEGFIQTRENGGWSATFLGAMLFARHLADFPALSRKVPRVVFYRKQDRIEASFEFEVSKGYAAGFEGLMARLEQRLPLQEFIGGALRAEGEVFPRIALRELVANALIHQDLTWRGAGPMIEVFVDRVEISNPGMPLVDTVRMIDAPPRSRNERLATFMRRIGICEERGSGIDKVVNACELAQLPAPDFSVVEGFTKATLFAPKPLRLMSRMDRIRACYQHAVLQWVANREMTNASIRRRFGIDHANAAQASRIIREAIEEKQIREFDPENKSNRFRRYVPFWA